jgi:hypothetical protein
MDTIQLTSILQEALKNSRCYFGGVFPRDKLPKKFEEYPVALVVNTDPSYKSGEHWVALYINSENDYEYFDSFGLLPLTYELQMPNATVVNKNTIQSLSSMTCGHFCVFYLVHRPNNSPS